MRKKSPLALFSFLLLANLMIAQANQNLSNLLSPTAINQSLVPGTNGNLDLGTTALKWNEIYLSDFGGGVIWRNGVWRYELNSLPATTTYNWNTGMASGTQGGQINIFIGNRAGEDLTGDGRRNVVIGHQSGANMVNASNNVFIGYQAGFSNNANNNTFIGNGSGASNLSGTECVGVGGGSMGSGTSAYHSTAIGYNSLANQLSGKGNTGLGWASGNNITTGSNNTCVGRQAGSTIVGTNGNSMLGDGADVSVNTVANSTAIGLQAKVGISNAMAFGRQGNGSAQVTDFGFGVNPSNMAAGICLQVGIAGNAGNGAFLSDGGMWTDASTRDLKDRFDPLDPETILKKVNDLEITRWRYTGTEEFHIGPVAEDFYAAFEVGVNNKSIGSTDPGGVALIAIQALSKRLEALEGAQAELILENEALKQQLASGSAGGNSCGLESRGYLGQNNPNPFSEKTRISYKMPANSSAGKIVFYDSSGREVYSQNITPSAGQIELEGNSLLPGLYVYALFVNDMVVDTKQMIVMAK